MEEAFEFAKHAAFHPAKPLEHALVIDISLVDHEAAALGMWARA
jgi:hypothetical protein